MDFGFLWEYRKMFLSGALTTLGLAAIGVLMGTVLGVLLAILRRSRIAPLRWIGTAYVEFMRGTPILIQQSFAAFGLPQLLHYQRSSGSSFFLLGAIVLGLNSAAYVSEIIRSGIQSVDKGQLEAARSLGMPQNLAMRKIILPQAIKNILPALGNEFIVVVKESSVANLVGVTELMFVNNRISSMTYNFFQPQIVTALIYFVITFTLSKLLGVAERRMDRGKMQAKELARRAAEAELLSADKQGLEG